MQNALEWFIQTISTVQRHRQAALRQWQPANARRPWVRPASLISTTHSGCVASGPRSASAPPRAATASSGIDSSMSMHWAFSPVRNDLAHGRDVSQTRRWAPGICAGQQYLCSYQTGSRTRTTTPGACRPLRRLGFKVMTEKRRGGDSAGPLRPATSRSGESKVSHLASRAERRLNRPELDSFLRPMGGGFG